MLQVALTDIDDFRLDWATRHGADDVINVKGMTEEEVAARAAEVGGRLWRHDSTSLNAISVDLG